MPLPCSRLLLASILALAAACSAPVENAPEPIAASGSLSGVLATGKIRIGTALYPPWALRGPDGELRGFEVDVGEKLAGDLGVEPQFVVLEWDALLPALVAHDIDIIVAGMSITPERARQVNFSQPYASSGIGMATNLALTAGFESIRDLDDPSVTIAALEGSVSQQLVERTFPKASLRLVKTSEEAASALVAGEVHAMVAANPVPRFVALANPDTVDEPVKSSLLPTREGFAIRKGDADFLAYLNAWITAREADTWLGAHHEYWFNSLRWHGLVQQEE